MTISLTTPEQRQTNAHKVVPSADGEDVSATMKGTIRIQQRPALIKTFHDGRRRAAATMMAMDPTSDADGAWSVRAMLAVEATIHPKLRRSSLKSLPTL